MEEDGGGGRRREEEGGGWRRREEEGGGGRRMEEEGGGGRRREGRAERKGEKAKRNDEVKSNVVRV